MTRYSLLVIDEELRAFERASTTGGVRARLEFARALERAGRHDEALAVLALAREDPEVRREIGRFPAWTQLPPSAHDSDHGGSSTAFAHVAPARGPLSPRWRRSLVPNAEGPLLASELGVVVLGRRRLSVLETATGHVRWELNWEQRPTWIVGDVLLSDEYFSLVARDIWTGEELYREPLAAGHGEFPGVWAVAGFYVRRRDALLSVHAFPDSRQRPSPTPLWTRPAGISGESGRPRAVFVAPNTIVAGEGYEVVVLDPLTGAVRWRAQGERPLADGEGVVAWIRSNPGSRPRQGSLVVYDREGRRLWTREEFFLPAALSPDFVVAAREQDAERALIERRSGRVLRTLSGPFAIARDLVFHGVGAHLEAIDPTGTRLWSRMIHAGSIAVLGHRLVVHEPRFVVCHEESAPASSPISNP